MISGWPFSLVRIALIIVGIFALAFAGKHGGARVTVGRICTLIAGALCIAWGLVLVRF